MRALVCLLVIAPVLAPSLLAAQRRPLPIGPGELVRVWAPPAEERREGVVVEIDTTTLLIARLAQPFAEDQPMIVSRQIDTIAVERIRQLHVRRQLDAGGRVNSAVAWGVVGAIAGAVAGGAYGNSRPGSADGLVVLGFGMIGTALGGLSGAVIGVHISDRWERVRLPVDTLPRPGRAVRGIGTPFALDEPRSPSMAPEGDPVAARASRELAPAEGGRARSAVQGALRASAGEPRRHARAGRVDRRRHRRPRRRALHDGRAGSRNPARSPRAGECAVAGFRLADHRPGRAGHTTP